MKCYKLLLEASIDFREDDKSTSILLSDGDFLLINDEPIYVLNTENKYSELLVLNSIYYKKHKIIKDGTDDFNLGFDWDYVTLNIASPLIRYKLNRIKINPKSLILEGVLEDYSVQWNRNEKLKHLIF